MNRRGFLLVTVALPASMLLIAHATAAGPATRIASVPAGYTGPWRFWGDQGRGNWTWEIVPTEDGPFRHLDTAPIGEWWNGREWVATD